MVKKSKKILAALIAVFVLMTLISTIVLVIWSNMGGHHESEMITVLNVPAPKRWLPLASIPWKRDTDSFSVATVPMAGLPWIRDDSSAAATLNPAGLPWIRIVEIPAPQVLSFANTPWTRDLSQGPVPVNLDTASIPWIPSRDESYTPIVLALGALPWKH
jgi:hypothetical protein